MSSSPHSARLLAGPALLTALFAATACGSATSTPSATPDSTSAISSSVSAQPDPALAKALLDQASLPPGYTLFSPDANAIGQAAAGAVTDTAETTFSPAECAPAKIKIAPDAASATMTATTAGASATITEVATRQLHNSSDVRANLAKCANSTITTKVMGVETAIRVTRTPVDAPRGAADDLVVVEERFEGVDPATAAPTTSLTAYANSGKVAIRLTADALDRPAFDSLVAKAAERARAAG